MIVVAALALSACSAGGGAEVASTSGGTIELAVSETCADESGSQCVLISGEDIELPATFEQAGVEDAAVAGGEEQNAIDVTFDEDGAALLHSLTEEAAGTGPNARLVVKIGDDVLAAVHVMQALTDDHVQIVLSPDDDAQETVDLLR